VNSFVGQVVTDLPVPGWAPVGLIGLLVAVVGSWLRAVLLAQAAARKQQDGWTDIVAEKDRQLDRKDREMDKRDITIERLVLEREAARRERDEARSELARLRGGTRDAG